MSAVVPSDSTAVPAIEVRNLSKRFGDTLAVDDVSFALAAGEVVGFLGPNGAGKTTTMRVLTGFLPASEGSVRIAGHDVVAQPLQARRAIGYLPETPPLYPEMTVLAYLRYVTAIRDVARRDRKQAISRALERCGLENQRHQVIRNLSKGYRQRVGLAQAIVHDPAVLVLDEPTVGLDPIQIREIRALIADLAATGASGSRQTVMISTHILPEVEAICDRIVLMDRGRKALDQPLSELIGGGRTLEEVFAKVTAADTPARSSADTASPVSTDTAPPGSDAS
jgi:ABC-2 type transport system ATP-binding protein